MKKTLSTAIFLFIIWFSAKADHHVAMDLTYRFTGVPDQYEVTLTFYRDCDGMSMPASIDVCFRSVSCNFLGSVTLNRISGPSLVPWPACVIRPPGAGGCNGGGVYDIQKAVFRGTLFLPYQCSDWQFEYVNCCRNYDITTINPAGTENIYIDARIDNLNYPVNSSPVFNALPANIWCLNKEQIFDPGTVETDGDSLVYELRTPRSLGNMIVCDPANPAPYNVNYVNGYTPQNFMASLSGIDFNPATGVIKFTPSMLQVSVVDLMVKEYRNGQLIGSVIRSLQFFITPQCQSSVPEFVTGTVNGVNNAIAGTCNDQSLVLTLDKNILCSSIASDGSDFQMKDAAGVGIPVTGAIPHSCTPPYDNQVTVLFSTPLSSGISKIWSKLGVDNNTLVSECNDQLPINDTVNVVVAPCTNVVAGLTASDTSFCERTCINFTDNSTNSPTSWFWTFPGAVPPTSTDQHPVNICYLNFGTFDVQLVACNGNDCDTILLPAYIKCWPSLQVPVVTIVGDTLICSNAQYYQWFMNGVAIPGATSQTYVVMQPGAYYVNISDDYGCETSSDEILITTTSLSDASSPALLNAYPNPFSDKLILEAIDMDAQELTFVLYTLTGQQVASQKIISADHHFKTTKNTSGLFPGIYIVEMQTESKRSYYKISKTVK